MTACPPDRPLDPAGLVRRLGGHPSRALGIDLADGGDAALGRWWVAALLLAQRGSETRACAALRALANAGIATPPALAGAAAPVVGVLLAEAGHPRPAPTARRLVAASRTLAARFDGSLERLAAGCTELTELSGALGSLAPGIGAAAVQRFLAPLRERIALAAELPLHPAARAAAHHLGFVEEDADDPDEAAVLAALRRRLATAREAVPLADVEAALQRLGERACRAGRPERCPLGADCKAEGRAASRRRA